MIQTHNLKEVGDGENKEEAAGEIVIRKSDTRDEHPRDKLGKVAEEEEAGALIAAKESRVSKSNEA